MNPLLYFLVYALLDKRLYPGELGGDVADIL
jgi:hypothetical protein